MKCRVGITTNLADRKAYWKKKYPNMRNWKPVGPFASRKAAQAWEDRQPCEKSGGGRDPDSPSAKWGYRFDF